MLLDLSVELLQEIAGELTQREQAVLRSVCKDLNDSVGPLFFSILVLKINRNGLIKDTVYKLKVLGTGGTGWSLHAKTLRITFVHVHVDPNFWECAQAAIFDFLNSCENLRELELIDMPGTIDLSALHCVRRLRKFALKSIYHDSNVRTFSSTISTPGIAELISQNQLRVLHLEGPGEWSPLWRMLPFGTHCTQLAELTTNRVSLVLFGHLSAYSGLRKLRLVAPDGGNLTMSNRLADMFFTRVLPRHADSLVELACAAAFEGRFSFGEHNVHVILQLQKLTWLEVSINAGAVVRNNSGPPRIGYHNGIAYTVSADLQYPWMPCGIPAKAEQAEVDSVVTLLLQTAASLPALRNLTIRAAEAEQQRGLGSGSKLNHIGAVKAAIVRAVKGFRTEDPSAAAVYIP
ncbi:F-box domain-containing protein [Mycena sanguinolenta]|uniref:F-box domain-containing protein n=1 Tax=Mycena sanguinolenta TaxID=230812 RepID=A0A8H6Y2R3_9AGAR|nr:F-box domain-containing protein [Mycena sanguinolenta]